jgi:hypothetical protein
MTEDRETRWGKMEWQFAQFAILAQRVPLAVVLISQRPPQRHLVESFEALLGPLSVRKAYGVVELRNLHRVGVVRSIMSAELLEDTPRNQYCSPWIFLGWSPWQLAAHFESC